MREQKGAWEQKGALALAPWGGTLWGRTLAHWGVEIMLWWDTPHIGVLKSCLGLGVGLGDNHGGSVDCTTQLL